MAPEKQRQIASKGGKAAHQKGTAHEFTSEEARAAGRKGGQAAHQRGTAHQFTSQEAAAAGRKGGRAAHQRAAARQSPRMPENEGQVLQPPPAMAGQETSDFNNQTNGILPPPLTANTNSQHLANGSPEMECETPAGIPLQQPSIS
jgi:general stress protein YciG